jgi:hypothetical protein
VVLQELVAGCKLGQECCDGSVVGVERHVIYREEREALWRMNGPSLGGRLNTEVRVVVASGYHYVNDYSLILISQSCSRRRIFQGFRPNAEAGLLIAFKRHF